LPDFLETVGGLIITRDVTQAVIETVLKANVNVVRLDYRPRNQSVQRGVLRGRTFGAPPDASSQVEAVRDMVDRQDLTGVIAIDDLTACRLIRELVALDVKVPESKSVVSIGGLPRDQLTEPNLARVNRGYFKMGAETARTLLLPSKLLVKNSLDVSFEAGRTLQPK